MVPLMALNYRGVGRKKKEETTNIFNDVNHPFLFLSVNKIRPCFPWLAPPFSLSFTPSLNVSLPLPHWFIAFSHSPSPAIIPSLHLPRCGRPSPLVLLLFAAVCLFLSTTLSLSLSLSLSTAVCLSLHRVFLSSWHTSPFQFRFSFEDGSCFASSKPTALGWVVLDFLFSCCRIKFEHFVIWLFYFLLVHKFS